MVIRSRWRTQKIDRSRSGIASTFGLNENTARRRASAEQVRHARMSTVTSSSTSTRPGLARKLNRMTPRPTPITTAASSAIRKEMNRAISAAVSARSSEAGPEDAEVAAPIRRCRR